MKNEKVVIKRWFEKPVKIGLIWKIKSKSFFTLDIYDIDEINAMYRAGKQIENVGKWFRSKMN
jgi:hypothetical protein